MFALPKVLSGPSKLWCSYKIGLDVLNAQLNTIQDVDSGQKRHRDPRIQELLADPQDAAPTWERLFEAERRLLPLMSNEMVAADALRKFARAKEAGLPETEALQSAFEKSKTHDQRRALHEQMVDSLHAHHFHRGLERNTQRRTATRLNLLGIIMLVPTVVVIVLLIYSKQFIHLAHYHIILVMWFGLLGAFLSRMIAFQGAVNNIPYDTLVSEFSVWSILVRLIVGAMGALIVYMMIAGKLLGGDLFPEITLDGFFDQIPINKKIGDQGAIIGDTGKEQSTMHHTDLMADIFTAEFAKLLVWATIAGFSERLLPDRLAGIEAMSQSKGSET